MKQNDLTQGKTWSTLLKFTIPFLLSSLLQTLYTSADLWVVSNFSSSSAVSAVSISGLIMQTITYIIIGLTTGGTILISQYFGAKKYEDVADSIGSFMWMLVGLAVSLTALALIFKGPIISIMQTPDEALTDALNYVTICSWGIPFIVGYNAVSAIFRGLGDSKTPLYFVGIACVINIIVDIVLVWKFSMGAAGAAIATVASQGISFILCLIYMKIKGFSFEIHLKNMKPKKALIVHMLKFGAPISLQSSLGNISFMVINSLINAMGVAASAAVGIAMKIISFAMLVPSSFSAAVSAMSSQNIGAGLYKRSRQCLYYGIAFSLSISLVITLILHFTPETVVKLFSQDADVIILAGAYLTPHSFDCILGSFVFCANGFFNSCGYSSFSMVHSLSVAIFIRITLSYVFSHGSDVYINMYNIGWTPVIATSVSLIACIVFFIYGLKHNKFTSIIKTEESKV